MVTIKFKQHHGDRIVQAEQRKHIFAMILADRIRDGYWYEGDDQEAAKYALECGRSEQFLRGRRDYEYEGYEDVAIERI